MTGPNKIEARSAGRRFRASDSHRFCKSTITRFPVDIHQEIRGREKEILRVLGITPRERGHQRCPFPGHEDHSPSWRWDAGTARWFCPCGFGTVVDAAVRMLGVSDREAIAWIKQHLAGTAEAPRRATILKFQSRREETAEARDRRLRALEIWRNGVAIAGTPAEIYLCGRGLDPDKLRHDPPGWPETLRRSDDACTIPGGGEGALIAAINERGSGRVVAIQRIFLHADGSPVLGPDGKKVKKVLGGFRGHAAGLSAWPYPEDRWGIAEGIESALAAQQLCEFPVYAAISAGNMANVMPPSWARHAVVFADHDPAGMAAAHRAAAVYRDLPALEPVGVIRAIQPGTDAADVLREASHG